MFSLCRPAAVSGQTTGAIEGRVLEPSGQALSGVRVEAKSPSLQGDRTAMTAADGGYRLPGLPPGSYTVQASMKGFTTVQKTARVALNAMSTADFTLQLSAEESLVVSGEAPTIDLRSAATGTTYTATVLRRIAIIRNYADILRLQPGVQPDTAPHRDGPLRSPSTDRRRARRRPGAAHPAKWRTSGALGST